MNGSSPSSSTFNLSTPAGILFDGRNRNSNLRQKILRNEQDRIQLEQKLRSMLIKKMPNHKRRQVQHIQTYFNRLNRDSQQAEQRNLNLLHDLTEAQQRLDQLHNETENLIRLKEDYLVYLERHYPDWQRPVTASGDTHGEYDRLEQELRQDRLKNDGNLRTATSNRQSFDFESSMLYKRYEDLLKSNFGRTQSPVVPQTPFDLKDDERFMSELNENGSNFSRVKRAGSLRLNLTSSGLVFLLDYLEQEIRCTIDKTKIYADDKPSLSQKSEIINIANRQDKNSLTGFDAGPISMVVFDQLHSTIQRNTIHQCFLTDEILSYNFFDLDTDSIAARLPQQDRHLWMRLMEHFGLLLRQHIMDISTLVDKFALALLTTNVQDLQVKAKSLMKHILRNATKKSSTVDENNEIHLHRSLIKSNDEESI